MRGSLCAALGVLRQTLALPGRARRIVAHRGGLDHVPENTLAAFRFALDRGVGAVECDAQRTRDGRYVLLHDDHIGRTGRTWPDLGPAKKLAVASLDSVELRGRAEDRARYEFGSHKGGSFAGEPAPFLEEFLDQIAGHPREVLGLIELKTTTLGPDDPRAIVKLVRRMHDERGGRLEGRIGIISFGEDLCSAAADEMCRLGNAASMVGFITSKYPDAAAYDRLTGDLLDRLGPGRVSLHLNIKAVLKDAPGDLAADAVRRGFVMNAWTLRSPADVAAVLERWPDAWLTLDNLDLLA